MRFPKFYPVAAVLFSIFAVMGFSQSVAGSERLSRLIVEPVGHDRVDMAVFVPLSDVSGGVRPAELALEEVAGEKRVSVATQIEAGAEPRLWWIVSGVTKAGEGRTYELVKTCSVGEGAFCRARTNGLVANEGFKRCQRYVKGWLAYADAKSGLLPRRIIKDKEELYWNAKDCAADNYPFMVLTAAITDRELLGGRMLEMLRSETKLTSRVGTLPDTYDFGKAGFVTPSPEMGQIMFGASEYIKDGLLAVTEWLGASPWSERMIGMLDDMWKNAAVETPYGKIVSENVEVNGEMLQSLSRVYWMTGDEKYLEWAVRLGDYYLLGNHHPTRNLEKLRLRDHGCEIVSGLCELYAMVNFAAPEKKRLYEKPIHEMLDRILEVGRNDHGLFYSAINPMTGAVLSERLADTWGYTLNGYYTVYLVDKTDAYLQAVVKALGNLNKHYKNYQWGYQRVLADEYADSIEGAINLYNRERLGSVREWLDSEIKVMWGIQKPSGVIEGWYGDGNFARTTLMYCLWKTSGVTIRPWREDVVFGAAQSGQGIKITITAEKPWKGKVLFDTPRHRVNMKMPLDWPRINQFPEWFTVEAEKGYSVRDLSTGAHGTLTGAELVQGMEIELAGGIEQRFVVQPVSTVLLRRSETFVDLEADGDKILRYNYALMPPPEGKDPLYVRSGFIHPAWSPKGTVLTRIHPDDHVHHMGIWMPWTHTKFEDRTVDFWNLGKGEGTVRFAGFGPTESGPVYARLTAQQEHVDLKAPDGEKIALNETLDLRAYNVGGRERGLRYWDLVSTQSCATEKPVHQLKYHYGGIGFRGTGEWTDENSDYLTSAGKGRSDGSGSRGRWCDVSGETSGGVVGLTIMSHPDNFRHPEPYRIWRKGGIFVGYAPEHLGDWTMEPGKNYVFRYRFYAHEGKISPADIERVWNDFAERAKVKVEKISSDNETEKKQKKRE